MKTPGTFSFSRGAHVCHLFGDFNEQKEVVLPFLLEGLTQGEAFLYITGRQSIDDWLVEFQASGVDVQRERGRKALTVTSGAEFRSPTATFNSIVKAGDLLRFINERLADFPAVRIAGDVAWEWEPPLPVDKLCHWEATANLVLEGLDVRTVCQYDLSADSPAVIHSALRTHPQVLLHQRLYANPFYEAPRILENEPYLNHSDGDASNVTSMVREIESSRPLAFARG